MRNFGRIRVENSGICGIGKFHIVGKGGWLFPHGAGEQGLHPAALCFLELDLARAAVGFLVLDVQFFITLDDKLVEVILVRARIFFDVVAHEIGLRGKGGVLDMAPVILAELLVIE